MREHGMNSGAMLDASTGGWERAGVLSELSAQKRKGFPNATVLHPAGEK
jgi:hypothetical protein